MKKATDLRAHLAAWVPDLKANPDKLHVFIDKGSIATRYGNGLAFQYAFTVQLVVTDFAESPDTLIVPLLSWIETNQPDLLLDPVKRDKLLAFEAEIIDHDKIDLAITIELTERVLVTAIPAGYQCEHLGEPQLPDLGGPTGWSLIAGTEIFAP